MSLWRKLFGGSSAPAAQPTKSTPAPSQEAASLVKEVKDIIRKSSGARDFVARANRAGFRTIKEDFIGLYLQKEDCTVILAVLPSHGPDTIWCLSMASKGSETVNLIDEGKITF